jgi:uncharacterized protein (TIRG00374 family)
MTANPSKRKTQALKTLLKAVIGVTIAFVLIRFMLKQNNVDLGAELRSAIVHFLVLAYLCYATTTVFSIFRWKLLLDAQGVRLSVWELTRLTMIGVFFNIALPGAVSGDFLKMVYVSKHAGERTAEAVLTIMLDRVFGLLGLLIVATMGLAVSLNFVRSAPKAVQLGAVVVGCGTVAAVTGMLAVQFREQLQRLPGVQPLIDFGARILPDKINGIIGRVVKAMDIYRDQKRIVLFAAVLSVIVHVFFGACVFGLAKSVNEPAVSLKLSFLASGVANSVASIPLTPAGLGGRDLVLAEYFKAGGGAPEKAGTISAFLSIIIATWSMVGLLFFVFARGEEAQGVAGAVSGIPPDEELEPERNPAEQ